MGRDFLIMTVRLAHVRHITKHPRYRIKNKIKTMIRHLIVLDHLKNLAVSEPKEMVLVIILDELILIKARALQMINGEIDGLETKTELHLQEKLI